MNGIWVRSEDGSFLGIVSNFRLREARWSGFDLIGNYRALSDHANDWNVLAHYDSKEAVVEQIDRIQEFMQASGIHISDYPNVFDLRKHKIQE